MANQLYMSQGKVIVAESYRLDIISPNIEFLSSRWSDVVIRVQNLPFQPPLKELNGRIFFGGVPLRRKLSHEFGHRLQKSGHDLRVWEKSYWEGSWTTLLPQPCIQPTEEVLVGAWAGEYLDHV